MKVLAVPVKRLDRAKHRLSPILTPGERAALTLAMLEDVLDACLAQPGWEVWVVSGSERAYEAARTRGARAVAERSRSLNEAVRQIEDELGGPADELAVVLADLPFLSASALAEALAVPGPVVASPAASDGGTNLLVRRPPWAIRAMFGRASFAKHRWAARRAGLAFAEVARLELGFDLDRPRDLITVLRAGRPGRTTVACREMGLAERLRQRA